MQRLKTYFNSFSANHDKTVKAKDYDPDLPYFKNNLSDKVEKDYYDDKGEFEKIIVDIEHSHTLIPTIRHLTMLSPSSSSHNLPPLKIPEFSGKYTELETYRDLFITVVHNVERATDVEKLSCLLMGVHGKALEIVNKFNLSVSNYKPAWDALVSHYENKRRLVNTHMSELLHVKPMKDESYANLKN